MLKDMTIESLASSDTVYRRGVRYFTQQAVKGLKYLEDRFYSAVVCGSEDYSVTIRLSQNGSNVERYSCTCPAAEKYLGACKHVVAVLKEIQSQQEEESEPADKLKQVMKNYGIETLGELYAQKQAARKDKASAASRRMFAFFKEAARQEDDLRQAGPVEYAHLVPRLFVEEYYGSYRRWLEFRFGLDKLYVVKNVSAFIEALEKGEPWPLGSKTEVNLAQIRWGDELSAKIFAMAQRYYHAEQDMFASGAANSYYYMSYRSYLFEQKQFRLPPDALAEFLDIMGDTSFELRLNAGESESVCQCQGNPQIALALQERDGYGELLVQEADIMPLADDCRFLYKDGIIYRTEKKFAQALKPLLQTFEGDSAIKIRPADLPQFFGQVLPQMEKAAAVTIDPKFLEEYAVQPLAAELYIDYEGDGIAVRPKFIYGDAVFNPLVEKEPPLRDGRKLVRDERGERELLLRVTNYGFSPKRDQLVQPDEARSYEFLTEELPQLPAWVDVFYADAFGNRPVRAMP